MGQTMIPDYIPYPGEVIDWNYYRPFPWIERLHQTPHDLRHHYEGNVGVHVHMVCQEIVNNPQYAELTENDRKLVFMAGLMHDIAKPSTTKLEDDGSITSRGHSKRGSIDARAMLWQAGWSFEDRETVARLTLYHQHPFHIFRKDPVFEIIKLSLDVRLDLLHILAESDARGRKVAVIAPGGTIANGPYIERPDLRQAGIDTVELFALQAKELDCYTKPYDFPDAHTKYCFLKGGRSPDYPVYDDTRCRVVVMSGLPGAGKSTCAESLGLPIIGFDEIRVEEDINNDDNQGHIVQEAFRRAREKLGRRQGFVWNATNISALQKQKIIKLLDDYNARIEFVSVELNERELRKRNRGREACVPDIAIDAMLKRWEPPMPSEAHHVTYIVDGVVYEDVVKSVSTLIP